MGKIEREHPMFSLCGLNCALCAMHLGNYCPGCGGGAGNQPCAIARCGAEHGVEFCWLCCEYPCGKYERFDDYDSFVPHSVRRRDVERARLIGLDAYFAELEEKAEALHLLLERFNDGRRKTFFSVAVYLLELSDVRAVMQRLHKAEGLPLKERASRAAILFQRQADALGISLKLNKKPSF